jgi:L-malate glycosyltransferase
MRVAIIIPRLEQLGPVKVIQALVNTLSSVDQLTIKVFYLDRTVDPQIGMKVPVERLDRENFCFGDYDIIHTNGIRPDLFAFINRKKIKCHISTIHNFVFADLSFTYNRIISWFFGNVWLMLWRRADKLICVSDTMKEYYSKWFPESKLEVIYNGITEPDDSQKPDIDIINAIEAYHKNGYNVIGSAAILTKRKGIDQLLYMVKEVNDIALVVIGNGKELKNLKMMAEKLSIADRCFFCGFRSNAVNYFRYFDLFIVPSRSEGFGLALIEAVQQKVPVICSDISVFKELFNDDEVTFFKLDDRGSLLAAFRTAQDIGTSKINLAYSRYQSEYTAHLTAEKHLNLYISAS